MTLLSTAFPFSSVLSQSLSIPSLPPKPNMTPRPIHSAIRHLDRLRAHAHGHKPLSHLAQPRRRFDLASIPPLDVLRAGPEDLGGGGGARPDHAVDVDGVGLLGP